MRVWRISLPCLPRRFSSAGSTTTWRRLGPLDESITSPGTSRTPSATPFSSTKSPQRTRESTCHQCRYTHRFSQGINIVIILWFLSSSNPSLVCVHVCGSTYTAITCPQVFAVHNSIKFNPGQDYIYITYIPLQHEAGLLCWSWSYNHIHVQCSASAGCIQLGCKQNVDYINIVLSFSP